MTEEVTPKNMVLDLETPRTQWYLVLQVVVEI